MATNVPKSTNEDLERKLDEIKTALRVQTNTTSVLDSIDQTLNGIKRQLVVSERRTTTQYYVSSGVTGVLAAYVLKDVSPIGALIILILAVGILIGTGLKYGFHKQDEEN